MGKLFIRDTTETDVHEDIPTTVDKSVKRPVRYVDMFTYSAANAQEVKTKLYDLIKAMERGVNGYEVRLQSNKPSLIVNREQFDALLETLDMLQNNETTDCIRAIKKQRHVLLTEKTSATQSHGNEE